MWFIYYIDGASFTCLISYIFIKFRMKQQQKEKSIDKNANYTETVFVVFN